MAIHFRNLAGAGNSYAQIGQILLSASISMAQEGHSFFLLDINLHFNLKESEKVLFHVIDLD
jgi:hypothetical protein